MISQAAGDEYPGDCAHAKTPSGHDHAFCTELVQCGRDSDVRILANDKFEPEPGFPALAFFFGGSLRIPVCPGLRRTQSWQGNLS